MFARRLFLACTATCASVTSSLTLSRTEEKNRRSGILAVIGNTPLIEIPGLSHATKCRILAKCEHLNPGGSVKDRAALWIVEAAEREGKLLPGGTLCEGTGGNTGVALSMVAAAKGYKAIMCMPQSISSEKIEAMRTLGAEVVLCASCSYADSNHYFHQAAAKAQSPNCFFTNQFENVANQRSHFEGTAPEIWHQTEGKVDGFVCAAGTGGTISGCSQFLKSKNPNCLTFVIDPLGSALYDFVNGACTRSLDEAVSDLPVQDVHGFRTRFIPRSAGSSLAEGIGIDRVTSNFGASILDGAMQASDQEIVSMAYYLKEKEGVLVGPSAALNVLGAVKLARKLGPGHTVVTILCDGGDRYKGTLYNSNYLKGKNLDPVAGIYE